MIASAGFSALDWVIVAAYLAAATVLGAVLSGRQATIREFFLGGRKLPWWAISGSIVATEVSAATIVGVPTISYSPGGNLTYLQLALGSILARVVVAQYFVRKYYEREIYSPYDYVGSRLGPRLKHVTTGLFFLGAILGQGARLFIAASVLQVVTGRGLLTSIWLMGVLGVGWTMLGGMTTVVWTDVIQFSIVVLGALFAVIATVMAVPGGVGEIASMGAAAGKFQLFDLSMDPAKGYTLWCGLLAIPFLNLAAFGTDQVMAQRMFCCRDEREARKAILWSNVSLFIPVLMLMVGVALHAYFRHHPFDAAEAATFASNKNSLLPIFIVRALPVGVRGVLVAAIFAAAISSLLGGLTALSQTTVAFFVKNEDLSQVSDQQSRRAVVWSKLLVLGWGVVLCLMATGCIELAMQYANVIDLALSLVRYTYGPLLGIFLLAFIPHRRDDSGLYWAVIGTILAVLSMSIHRPGDTWQFLAAASCYAIAGIVQFRRSPVRLAVIIAEALAIIAFHYLRLGTNSDGTGIYPSTYWHYPIATLMTFGIGYLLGDQRTSADAEPKAPMLAASRG